MFRYSYVAVRLRIHRWFVKNKKLTSIASDWDFLNSSEWVCFPEFQLNSTPNFPERQVFRNPYDFWDFGQVNSYLSIQMVNLLLKIGKKAISVR